MTIFTKSRPVKKIFTAILFFLVTGFCHAQIFDSISSAFHHKPKFFFDLYGYGSSISDQPATFAGLGAGLSFNKKIYVGIGVTALNSKIIGSEIIANNTQSDTINAQLQISFLMLSTEYVFYKKYPWMFSVIPVNIGLGNGYYEYQRLPDKVLTKISETNFFIYNPGVYGSFNVLKWIGLSGSLGYRFTLYSSGRIHDDLDSFTSSIGIKLFVDVIYDAVFPHGICKKKKVE